MEARPGAFDVIHPGCASGQGVFLRNGGTWDDADGASAVGLQRVTQAELLDKKDAGAFRGTVGRLLG